MAKPSRFMLCCIGLLAAAQASADEVPPAWAGVWQGTIGTAEVRMCLQQKTYTGSSGMYYYMRYLRLIPLSTVDAPNGDSLSMALREAVPHPTDKTGNDDKAIHADWTLRIDAKASVIDGTWRGQAKALPVHLTRVRASDANAHDPALLDAEFCASDAFNAPREGPARVVATHAVMEGKLGTAYRALKLDFGGRFRGDIKSFELLRDDEGARRFNAAQRAALKAEQDESFGCARGMMARTLVGDSYYNAAKEPMLIGRHWVVSDTHSGGFCGGAHQTINWGHETWDLDEARLVEPWSWFKTGGGNNLSEDLNDMLAKAWALHDEDCKAVGEDPSAFSWEVYPSAKGMAFVPNGLPYVMRVCADEVVLPWRKVLPLLNAKGRKAVSSIRTEFAKPPAR